MIKYTDNKRNHVILPGRDAELNKFLNSTYKGINHKLNNSYSSNSEDALTWSCFDILSQLSDSEKKVALDEIIEHSYNDNSKSFRLPFSFESESDIEIEIGETYLGPNINEQTEVDAVIKTKSKLIFIEAKLYSSVILKDKAKPYDQIAKKIRVGLDYSISKKLDFYFIFLDIAPIDKLYSFTTEKICKENAMKYPTKKWKSAWWFKRYKNGWKGSLKPLQDILEGIEKNSFEVKVISKNMGWLTWSDLYKITMRGLIKNKFV